MTAKTAITYTRVSSEEQAKKGYSLSHQRQALREWCKQEGYTVIEEVADEGWSGAYLERPGLDRVRALVAAGGVDAVVALYRDRLARGIGAQLLAEELREHGTRLRALNSTGDDSPDGELGDNIMDVIAAWERRKIAQRTSEGRLRKAREGKLIACYVPHYGFHYTEDREGYTVDEQRMAVVRRIFRMAGEDGATIYAMKKALERDGVPTPSGGALWARCTIRTTILEDAYFPHERADLDALVAEGVLAREVADRIRTPCGIAFYNRRKTTTRPVMVDGERQKKQKAEVRPRAGWIAVPVPDAGIPRELAEAARATVALNRPASKVEGRVWELSGGTLVCGGCGCRMCVNVKRHGAEPGREYCYYRCSKRQRHGVAGCTQGKTFRAEQLERSVWHHVWPLVTDRKVGLATIDRQIQREKERGDPERERRRLAKIVEGAEAKRAKFQHAYAEGAMSLDDLKARSAEVEEQCRKAQEQLAFVRDSNDRIAMLEKVREMHLFYTAGKGQVRLPQLAEASPEERVRTYRRLGVRVEADPDGQVRVSGTLFPERLLVHTQNHSETW